MAADIGGGNRLGAPGKGAGDRGRRANGPARECLAEGGQQLARKTLVVRASHSERGRERSVQRGGLRRIGAVGDADGPDGSGDRKDGERADDTSSGIGKTMGWRAAGR